MKYALVAAVLLTGCNPKTVSREPSSPALVADLTNTVYRVRDEQMRVTCWVVDNINGRGISCLSDVQVGGLR